MLFLIRSSDVPLVIGRALDRHDTPMSASVPGRNVRQGWLMMGGVGLLASPGRLTHCASRRERLYPAVLEPAKVARDQGRWALSSAVEHYLDMVGVRGSIPLAPTIFQLFINDLATS